MDADTPLSCRRRWRAPQQEVASDCDGDPTKEGMSAHAGKPQKEPKETRRKLESRRGGLRHNLTQCDITTDAAGSDDGMGDDGADADELKMTLTRGADGDGDPDVTRWGGIDDVGRGDAGDEVADGSGSDVTRSAPPLLPPPPPTNGIIRIGREEGTRERSAALEE